MGLEYGLRIEGAESGGGVSRPNFPACYVEFAEDGQARSAAFYLAAEEYVAQKFPADNYLFTWVVQPTVVMGRNQSAENEINLDYCRRNGIDVIRRKSGGGCIYADTGNIMTSWITGAGAVEVLFAEYARQVCRSLRELGAPVEVSGRNDIVLSGGEKICGNAFYHMPRRNIVHGTMLYDTTDSHMHQALRPSDQKLASHGVKSVRSRIGLLKDVIKEDIGTLRAHLRATLCNRTCRLTDEDNREIRKLESEYYKEDFMASLRSRDVVRRSAYISQCGSLTVILDVSPASVIRNVWLEGDFFENGNAFIAFNNAFVGKEYTKESVREVIHELHPESSIRGLTASALTDLLIP